MDKRSNSNWEDSPGRAFSPPIRLGSIGEGQYPARIAQAGDRLRADLAGLDEKEIHLRHALLGALAIPRANAWKLYADPAFPMAPPQMTTRRLGFRKAWGSPYASRCYGVASVLGDWRYFDGQYFLWLAMTRVCDRTPESGSLASRPLRRALRFHFLRPRIPATPTPAPPAFVVSAAGVTFTIFSGSPKASVSASVPGLVREDSETSLAKVALGRTAEVQLQVDPKTGPRPALPRWPPCVRTPWQIFRIQLAAKRAW